MDCVLAFVGFFFKQKTAYEMRISDWSSDVCSSDLLPILLEVVRLVCVARNDVRTPILKRLRSHRTANAKLLGLAGKLPRRWRSARRRCAGGSAFEQILICCVEFSLTDRQSVV